MVDLSDESGNLKYLRGHPESYATEFLKDRESLVLIRVDSKYRLAAQSCNARYPALFLTTCLASIHLVLSPQCIFTFLDVALSFAFLFCSCAFCR